MTVFYETGYALPGGDEPLTHARILHARNWLSGGTASASGTDADYFEDAPLNSLTYEKWKPDALAATWEYDHGSAAECDCCCIAAHDMGSNGNSLDVEYYTGAAWVSVFSAPQSVADDSPIMVIFEPETRQRWRIGISGGTAPTIGAIRFGAALQMARPLFGGHAPVNTARRADLAINRTDTGEVIGRSVRSVTYATAYEWNNLSTAWVRANWPDLQRAIEAEPFWIAWRPGDNGDVAYAQTDTVPIPQNTGIADLMAVGLQIRMQGYD